MEEYITIIRSWCVKFQKANQVETFNEYADMLEHALICQSRFVATTNPSKKTVQQAELDLQTLAQVFNKHKNYLRDLDMSLEKELEEVLSVPTDLLEDYEPVTPPKHTHEHVEDEHEDVEEEEEPVDDTVVDEDADTCVVLDTDTPNESEHGGEHEGEESADNPVKKAKTWP